MDGIIGPGAGHDDGAAGVKAGAVGRGEVEVGVEQLLHTLDGDEALGAVEGVLDGDEGAVGVSLPLGDAAGAEEPGRDVPRGGLILHGEVLLGGLAVGDQFLEGADVFLGDDGLVIVHEVAVVGSQGVGVELAAGGGGGDSAAVVVGADSISGGHAELGQSAGLHQAGELVLREAEDVAAGFDVGDHLRGGVALAHGLDRRVEGDAVGVGSVEVGDLLLGQIDDGVGDPNGDVIGAGEFAAGSSGSALGGPGRRLGGRSGSGAAAGAQSKDHDQSKDQCQNFFHVCSS